ncbi:hypothetical protein [Nocardiopsis suaedae]|uniref:Uncharacterized protein n=1 Tax=Nocardiopsis suaedae TaxID=3018444 RepID=A0ABT4TR81_9ACTN|nr:hypothetical protein [Nocardiopsis suaedae]MDA2806886.1 hypothetical protein [Nocardiopsis suaedae]
MEDVVGEQPVGVSVHDELVVAEYVSIRSEIIKLIELQSQIVSLVVVSVGAVLGVAAQTSSSGLAFVYPVLALILGTTWLNHAHSVSRCALYLAQNVELHRGNGALGWEGFVQRNPLRFGMLGYWGVRSIFMGSSLVALAVGWSLIEKDTLLIIAGVISSAISLGTVVLFMLWREPSPRKLLVAAQARKAYPTE